MLLEELTLAFVFVDFVGKMCVFVSRPMEIVTFLRKTLTPQNGLLIFLGKETHSETKSWKSSRIFNEKSYNNIGKPWKSSRILRVKPNFFIFSLFIIFSFSSFFHVHSFSVIFFHFLLSSFSFSFFPFVFSFLFSFFLFLFLFVGVNFFV